MSRVFTVKDLESTVFESYKSIPNKIPKEFEGNAQRLVELMNRINKEWVGRGKKDLTYTCAYRSPEFNSKAGGKPTSAHLSARAVDWVVLLEDQDEFMSMLNDMFLQDISFASNYIYKTNSKGVKTPRNFVHMDIAKENENPRNILNTVISKGNEIVWKKELKAKDLYKGK